MKIVEVNKVDQILEAKSEIELLNPDKPKQDLQTFINGLDMKDTIFVKDDIVIPFSIKSERLFVITEKDEHLSKLLESLQQFDYDLSKLVEIPIFDVYNGKLEKYDFYFIIVSKYKVFDK